MFGSTFCKSVKQHTCFSSIPSSCCCCCCPACSELKMSGVHWAVSSTALILCTQSNMSCFYFELRHVCDDGQIPRTTRQTQTKHIQFCSHFPKIRFQKLTEWESMILLKVIVWKLKCVTNLIQCV